ncbi:MAG: hypothetical protein K2L38_09035 [Dysosmobacter sp.]|nr:hypothetical protein [Dysosmobacter sp.]
MAYPAYQNAYYPQPSYQNAYYPQPVPDQLAQLRQQQMMQQPVQPMQTSTQPAAPQNGGINWVNSKQEADNWPIAPGCAVALWDSNNPVIYLRQADSTGKPSTKVYDLVERTDAPPQQTAPQIDLSQYVTIDQLEDILAERLKKPSRPAKQKEEQTDG